LPEDTRARFERHIHRARNAFSEAPDVVVVNAELWTIQNVQDRVANPRTFFEDERFGSFAVSYVQNVSLLIRLAREAFPQSFVVLMNLPGAGQNPGRVVNDRTVRKMNQVIRLASSIADGTCVVDWETMMQGFTGKTIEDDGRHPTGVPMLEITNLLLNMGKGG
jgi:hypothetical protein